MFRPTLNWECTKNLRLIHEPALATYYTLEPFEARFRNICVEIILPYPMSDVVQVG